MQNMMHLSGPLIHQIHGFQMTSHCGNRIRVCKLMKMKYSFVTSMGQRKKIMNFSFCFRHYVPPRRVKQWAFSLSELLADPLGRRHFTRFLEKEISAENLG